jgi:hypothetical protein
MNSAIFCTAVALNIFSGPGGTTVVGQVPAAKEVQLLDSSLMRDWVFIGKPGDGLPSPRGWVIWTGLRECGQRRSRVTAWRLFPRSTFGPQATPMLSSSPGSMSSWASTRRSSNVRGRWASS